MLTTVLLTLGRRVVSEVWKAHAGGVATTVTDVLSGGVMVERIASFFTWLGLDPTLAMGLAYLGNYAIGFIIPYVFPANTERSQRMY